MTKTGQEKGQVLVNTNKKAYPSECVGAVVFYSSARRPNAAININSN